MNTNEQDGFDYLKKKGLCREDFDFNNRVVKQEYITKKGVKFWISTVDLGLNHRWGEGEPLWYETMIFATSKEGINFSDLYCDRYTTREEAMAGHIEVVKQLKTNKLHLRNGYFSTEADSKYIKRVANRQKLYNKRLSLGRKL